MSEPNPCIDLALRSPPPPGREGFRREWVNEPGRTPYWQLNARSRLEGVERVALVVGVMDPRFHAGDDFRNFFSPEWFVWDPEFEEWIPPDGETPDGADYTGERVLYLRFLRTNPPNIRVELVKQQRDNQNYTYNSLRNGIHDYNF